ncbi:MAG: hypothetical protein ACK5H0_10260 [Bacteroidota bacterium]
MIEILSERLKVLTEYHKKAKNGKKLWKDRFKLLQKQVERLQQERDYYKKQLNIQREYAIQ